MRTYNKTQDLKNRLKFALIVFIVLFPVFLITECSAQKSKKQDIINLKDIRISAYVNYDELNEVIDTSYYMSGQNAKYSAIIDIVTLGHGTHSEVLGLLKKCLESLSEGKGTSLEHNESRIYITSDKALMLYGVGDDEDGYTTLNKTQLGKLIASMESIGK